MTTDAVRVELDAVRVQPDAVRVQLDAVRVELDARVESAMDTGGDVRGSLIRLLVWEDAVAARADGRLAGTLNFMRSARRLETVFRRVDAILGVPAPTWTCFGGRRCRDYARFTDDRLMEALEAAVTEN